MPINWNECRARVGQDVRYALRGLARSPGFALTVVLTFGLGVGANAAIFSLIDPLLVRNPAGVVEPDQVHRVYFTTPTGAPAANFSGASYTAIKEAVAGVARAAPKLASDSVTMQAAGGTTAILRESATSEYLPMLAGAPALGRYFSADEADVAAPLPRAVLSHALWRNVFGGDSNILGKQLGLGPTTFTIVGVAPKGFGGIDLAPVDLWTTAVNFARFPEPWYRFRNEKFGSIVMRVNRGADDRQAETRATHAYRRSTDSLRAVLLGSIVEGRGPVASKEVRISTRAAGVAVVVLLIACANIATLSLVRVMRRRREIAVRVALGVSRSRLIAQLMAETLLLSVIGGAAAVLIAGWAGSALRMILVPDVRFPTGALTGRVVLATLIISVVAGVLSGLAPSLSASRPDLSDALKSGNRLGRLRGGALRGTLLVAQGALSIVLIVGAGLFLRSLYNVHAIDLGLDPSRTIIGNVRPSSLAGFAPAMRDFADRVRPISGVEHVGLGTSAPFVHWDARDAFLPSQDTSVSLAGERPAGIGVDTGFFRAMGMRVRAGRGLEATDVAGAPNVIVVSETMARALWPSDSPLGKCLIPYSRESSCFTVVGVVSDLHQWALVEPPRMRFFVSLAQVPSANPLPTAIVVRATAARADDVAGIVHAEMRRAFPTARIMWAPAPVAQRLEPELRPWRVGAGLFVALGSLALFVATIGMYSVIAYTFSQRTQEIGVRMALGARSSDVTGLVLNEALRIVAIGAALGIVLALALGKLVASLLYGVSSRDPVVIALSAAVLFAAGSLAAVFPAWRACRVDPVVSLRVE